MFARIHSKLGGAGLVVAIIALVAAVAGTAFAAAKLNGTQKNEVAKIAKKWAKKIPGPAGAKGDPGPAGAKGDQGTKGEAGTPGVSGKSVIVESLNAGQAGCFDGGIKVRVDGSGSEHAVCNGEEGEPGPAGSPWVLETAPSGVVMKGTWVLPPATAAAGGEEFFVPVSTSVPINQKNGESEPLAIFSEGPPFCNGSAGDPEPPLHPVTGDVLAGAICIYKQVGTNIGIALNAESQLKESGGGAVIAFKALAAGAVSGYGSWVMGTP